METLSDIQVEIKVLKKELISVQKRIDENLEKLGKRTNELSKKDLEEAKEKIKQIYGNIASVSLSNGEIRIHFQKTENYAREVYIHKSHIEKKLGNPGMFNIKGSNSNSYGEYKTLLLTLTKKYLKSAYNL